MVSLSERVLIERSQQGDIESFEALIKKYQVYAYNIAYRMTSNKEDAKDITQEALIKAYKSINNFRFDSSFSTWLYRIVTNTCIDMLRKENKIKTITIDKSIETDEGEYQREIRDNRDLPEYMLEEKERREVIRRSIKKLSEKYREVLILRDIQNFSYEEISEITDLPLGTVKSRISRARYNLKEILSKEMEPLLKR